MSVLVILPAVIATSTGSVKTRVYVYPNTPKGLIRALGGSILHEFTMAMSVEIPTISKPVIQVLGFYIEDVPVRYITQGPPPGVGPPTKERCVPDNQIPWGIARVKAPDAWSTTKGAGTYVCILDTGIDTDHPDLVRRIKICETKVAKGWDSRSCEDGHGHGTHVAGTIAADGGEDGLGIFGVAPEAYLYIVKVCDRSGSCWSDDIVAGIDRCRELGADVISMSFGGSTPSETEHAALQAAYNEGIVLVAAAGNSGPDPDTIGYPAAFPEVISVAATDDTDTVPDWSSRGSEDPACADDPTGERCLEVADPGKDIESTYNDGCYAYMSGTSMSTPHVSGIVALLRSVYPDLTPQQVREKLWVSTDDITKGLYATEGYDIASGMGLVRADLAIS